MLDGLAWVATQIGLGFYNIYFAVTNPSLWLDWSDKEALLRVVYYGGSGQFFFAVIDIVLVLTVIGMIFRPVMWGMVRGLEGFANGDVFAISIDTAVFDGKQKTFRNAVLQRLDQFHQRDVRVVFVDIIAQEMKAHLRDDAIDTQRALKKALRAHNKRWRRDVPNGEAADLLIDTDATAFAQAEFDAFRQHVSGEEIAAGDTHDAVMKVFDRYFAESPPFGAADKRTVGTASSFVIVPVAVASAMDALVADDRVTVKASSSSMIVSPEIVTSKVCRVCPGVKVRVPLLAV